MGVRADFLGGKQPKFPSGAGNTVYDSNNNELCWVCHQVKLAALDKRTKEEQEKRIQLERQLWALKGSKEPGKKKTTDWSPGENLTCFRDSCTLD